MDFETVKSIESFVMGIMVIFIVGGGPIKFDKIKMGVFAVVQTIVAILPSLLKDGLYYR